jgi:CheY-like chemotaxis protein
MLGVEGLGGAQVVLVVEDDHLVRLITSDYLRDFGLNVFEAPTADDAMDVLASADVALVLTDVHMPGTNGLEFARIVRARQPETPIIVVSGRFEMGEVVDELGQHTMFVEKPYNIEQLSQEIARLVSARRPRKASGAA